MGIDGNIVCDGVFPSMVGTHDGIPIVKGPIELCENRLEEPIPPMGVALDDGLTPSIPIVIK